MKKSVSNVWSTGVLLVLLSLCPFRAWSQVDISRYFDENSFSFLDLNDYLEPAFQWTMEGNVQAFLNEGITSLQEGKLEMALSNIDEAIKLDSTQWISYYYKGICNKKLYKLKEARANLLKAISLNAKSAEAHVELGEIYHEQRDADKATKEYAVAIDLNPKLVQAYYNMGNLKLVTGDAKGALKNYEKCNEVDPKFPGAYVNQGLLKFKVKKSDNQSIAYFTKALDVDSLHSSAYFWRGLAYLSLEKTQSCVDDWSNLVRLNPSNTFYIFMRGFLYIELNEFDKAFVDLRRAIRSREINENKFAGTQTIIDKQIDLYTAANYLIAHGYGLEEETFTALKKAFCLLLSGRNEEALKTSKEAVAMQRTAATYYLEAIVLEHLDRHNDAYVDYTAALKLDNDIFDAHKKRSVYRMELNDWIGANQDFNDMFRLQPGSPLVHRLRGFARSHQKDYQGAVDDLTQFINTDSTDYETVRTRSVCYAYLKKDKEANDDMVIMLLLTPRDWDLRKDIAHNYLTLKDTTTAITLLNEVADHSSSARFMLAGIHANQKNWELARTVSMKVIESDSQYRSPEELSNLQLWLGMAEFSKSNFAEAINYFNKSIKINRDNFEAKYFRAKAYEHTKESKKALSDYKDLMNVLYRDSKEQHQALLKTLK